MESRAFFEAIITAGSVLAGFCGTFLSFRIQREASYHRQAALDFATGQAKDIFIGLTHFTSAFFLLALASLGAALFGFVFPLLALSGQRWFLARPEMAAIGLVWSLVMVAAYFVAEMVHYRIVDSRLLNESRRWGREWIGILVALSFATVVSLKVFDSLENASNSFVVRPITDSSSPSGEWRGFFYPDEEAQREAVFRTGDLKLAPTFETLQRCAEWGKRQVRSSPLASFECGVGCRVEGAGVVCRDKTGIIR
jgi:hypothetical protein